jgi:hypothetical protein
MATYDFNYKKPVNYYPRGPLSGGAKNGVPFEYRYPQGYYPRQVLTTGQAKPIAVDAVNRAVAAQVKNGTIEIFQKYIASMLRNIDKREDLENMHRNLALGARAAILLEYDKHHGKRPSYRNLDRGKLKRYSNKKLRKALDSPVRIGDGPGRSLFSVSAAGIGLFDVKFLDDTAKQWYRLNFGALPAGSSLPGQGSIRMFGRSSGKRLSLEGFGPSMPFYVPQALSSRGLWSREYLTSTNYKALSKPGRNIRNGEPGALYVVGYGKDGKPFRGSFSPHLSKGITGTRFLDAGVRYINNNYGKERTSNGSLGMVGVFKKWHEEAMREATRGTGQQKKVKVKADPPSSSGSKGGSKPWWQMKGNRPVPMDQVFPGGRRPKWAKPWNGK